MSIICEKICAEKNPLIKKASYATIDNFVKAYLSEKPKILSDYNKNLNNVNRNENACVLPYLYAKKAKDYQNFEVRKDDIWLITYPKTGTTWTQKMLWLLAYNLDYETDKNKRFWERCPFLEADILFDIDDDGDKIEKINTFKSPRIIKSHLPMDLLPTQLWTVCPKIIYVTRNPKDVAISYYHHYVNIQGYGGTFTDFMELFLADLIIYSPFHSSIVDFWTIRQEKNILFLTYEEMKRDLLTVIQKMSKFLNKNYSSTDLIQLKDYLSFDSMRTNFEKPDEIEEFKVFQQKLQFPKVDPNFK